MEVKIIDGLLDLNGAAKYLGISNRALRDLCKRGAMTYTKINYRTWRFRMSDLDAFLAARTFKAKSAYK